MTLAHDGGIAPSPPTASNIGLNSSHLPSTALCGNTVTPLPFTSPTSPNTPRLQSPSIKLPFPIFNTPPPTSSYGPFNTLPSAPLPTSFHPGPAYGFFANRAHVLRIYWLSAYSCVVVFAWAYVPNTTLTSDACHTPAFAKSCVLGNEALKKYRHVGMPVEAVAFAHSACGHWNINSV